jgi:exopolysaccharide biosynthesis polyprenyl glycosylphosphotransferase
VTLVDSSTTTRAASRTNALRIARSKGTLIALDLAAASFAIATAGWLAPAGPDRGTASLVLLAAWSLFLSRARLYTARFITRRSDEVQRILNATVSAAASAAVVGFVFRLEVGRVWLGLATLIGFAALSVEREIVRAYYDRQRSSGRLRRKVLMIGENDESRELELMFSTETELGYDVVRTVNPDRVSDRHELTTRVLSTAKEHGATGVVIAATAIDTRASNRLIRDLMEAGIHVEVSSTLTDIEPGRLTVRPLGRFPVVYVEPVQRGGWRAAAKRGFDLSIAATCLILAAPIGLAIAAVVAMTSPGGVLFRQARVGQNGSSFDVLKFRTMVADAEKILEGMADENDGAGPLFKMRDDPRVTRIGRFLRRTSLDELPQLWNVIRGEMSLVGPRPALASEMLAWDEDLYGRLRVKPGITGMWQVSGRSETSFEEYTRLDLYYVDNWSLVVDLIILVRTIPAVLRSDGAY